MTRGRLSLLFSAYCLVDPFSVRRAHETIIQAGQIMIMARESVESNHFSTTVHTNLVLIRSHFWPNPHGAH